MGIGYYKDDAYADSAGCRRVPQLDNLIAISDCTQALLAACAQTHIEAEGLSKRRARRARHPDGRRKKRSSRRSRACKLGPIGPIAIEATSDIGNKNWREQGLWAIDTANVNSWATLERCVLWRSRAHIVLAQESKILGTDRLSGASTAARAAGWNPALTPAHRTAANFGSGGNAVLVRKGSGLRDITKQLIKEMFQHRICVAWIDAVVKGGRDPPPAQRPRGLSQANVAFLEQLAIAIGTLRGPWIVGGDWNITPTTLGTSSWTRIVNGTIVATPLVTCNNSTYDFLVVRKALAHAVAGVQKIDDGGMNPHWVSRHIRGDARRFAVRKLVRPPKVEGKLPAGPCNQPPSYSEVERLCSHQQAELAMRALYTTARAEWSDLAGADLGFRDPRFTWQSAAGPTAKPWAGSTKVSVLWRSLARKAEDCACLIKHGLDNLLDTRRRLLAKQLSSCSRVTKSLSNTQRVSLQPQVDSWGISLECAVTHASVQCTRSLTAVADTRAKKAEALTISAPTSHWRQAVGATPEFPRCTPTPTKLAFRWVKGLAGWQHSPIGSSIDNGLVPDDPDTLDDETEVNAEVIHEGLPSAKCIPLCDQAAVQKEANSWAVLWQCSDECDHPDFPAEFIELERLYPWAIRLAARSFPIGTGRRR